VSPGATPAARTLARAELAAWGARPEDAVWLGELGGVPYGALALGPGAPDPGALFEDLRRIGALLDAEDAALLAYARGITEWHRRHPFCAACGRPTVTAEAGHVRRCLGPGCGTLHHPRTDPAVIVLVTHEGPRGVACLLGNQVGWAPEVYSTLAGFVEPGESAEDAVRREVGEEAGVRVTDVRYHSSQPWPFPASLMLGFTARALDGRVAPIDDELRDVRWFTREELLEGERSGAIRLSNPTSIARRLVEDWLAR